MTTQGYLDDAKVGVLLPSEPKSRLSKSQSTLVAKKG